MEKEYLSIKEFAKLAKVSPQSIYKRLNQVDSRLNNYVEKVGNQKKIDIMALKDVYNIEVEQPIQPGNNQVEQPFKPENQQSSTDKLLEMLQKQLEEKDKQISELQRLLDQQQKLSLSDRQIIQVLEDKLHTQETAIVETPPEDNVNKSFWKRIFKK